MVETKNNQNWTATVTAASHPDLAIDYAWLQTQPQLCESLLQRPQAMPSLESCSKTLVSTYLAANLNSRSVSLKALLWTLEREIVLTSMKLTLGNKKNTAAFLGIKPTTLFEKIRKFGLNNRQLRLSARLNALPPAKE